MGDELKLPEIRIRQFGTFNVKSILKVINAYFRKKGLDVLETSHIFRGGDGGEEEIKLYADKKLTHYIRYNVNMEIKAKNLKDVEVVKEGKKKKMQHGKIEIKIQGVVIPDWQKQWTKTKPKFLKTLYHKYLFSFEFKSKWIAKLDKIVRGIVAEINKELES